MAVLTEHDLRTMSRATQRFLEQRRLAQRPFDMGRPEDFDELVDALAQPVGCPDDEFRVAAAMFVLGPENVESRTVQMLDEVLAQLRAAVPDAASRLERAMEFVVAYGGGKWRSVEPGFGGWEHRWLGAIQALARAMEPAVAECGRWLTESVADFPARSRAEQWSDAYKLAFQFASAVMPLHLKQGEALTAEVTEEDTILSGPGGYERMIRPGGKAVWFLASGSATVRTEHREDVMDEEGDPVPEEVHVIVTAEVAVNRDTKVVLAAADESAEVRVDQPGQKRELLGVPLWDQAVFQAETDADLAVWECACGTDRCAERHGLEAWDPQATGRQGQPITLWSAAASAVKGPSDPLQRGAFIEGMYYPLLLDSVGLRSVPTAWKICPNPSCPKCGTEYEGGRCLAPGCGRLFDEATTPIASKDWLVIVGRYVLAWWWKCDCGNFYPATYRCCSADPESPSRRPKVNRKRKVPGGHDRCPLTAHGEDRPEHGQRATALWVRRFGKDVSWEEWAEQEEGRAKRREEA